MVECGKVVNIVIFFEFDDVIDLMDLCRWIVIGLNVVGIMSENWVVRGKKCFCVDIW